MWSYEFNDTEKGGVFHAVLSCAIIFTELLRSGPENNARKFVRLLYNPYLKKYNSKDVEERDTLQ